MGILIGFLQQVKFDNMIGKIDTVAYILLSRNCISDNMNFYV